MAISDHTKPYDEQCPEKARPYLLLIRQGVGLWNQWIKGEIPPAEIAQNLGLETFPDPPSEPDYNPKNPIYFASVDFSHPDNRSINFRGASFGDKADFSSASFGDFANFFGASFGFGADFRGASFGAFANFSGASFGNEANFSGTSFGFEPYFSDASFKGRVFFMGVGPETHERRLADLAQKKVKEESERAVWIEARLQEGFLNKLTSISFSRARFGGNPSFKNRIFEDFANFSHARFEQPPNFDKCQGMERLDVTATRFGFNGSLELFSKYFSTPGWTTDSNVPTRLRILRKQMDDIKAHDAERDLFIAERMAERGVLLKAALDKLRPLTSFLRLRWLPLLLKALGAIILYFFFWSLSDCGRSAIRPFLWFSAKLAGFYALYAERLSPGSLGTGWDMWRGDIAWDLVLKQFLEDIGSFTLGHALPFIGSVGPARQGAMERLFPKDEITQTFHMPFEIELLSMGQSILGALLLFLFLQAIRNHFRLR